MYSNYNCRRCNPSLNPDEHCELYRHKGIVRKEAPPEVEKARSTRLESNDIIIEKKKKEQDRKYT